VALDAWRSRGVKVVLDAGCGDGKNYVSLVRQGISVVGVDGSRTALRQCRNYVRRLFGDADPGQLAYGALDRLPLSDEVISAVLCVDVLGHLERPSCVLRELHRVLRPGGTLYTSIFHWDDTCRTGPRMRTGNAPGDCWYRPSQASSQQEPREFFYRFYREAAARDLFEANGYGVLSLEVRQWDEPGHEGYREEPHRHASWFGLLEKA
jgi:SAM-dependent methyltransferase